jgi:hypothetical protein
VRGRFDLRMILLEEMNGASRPQRLRQESRHMTAATKMRLRLANESVLYRVDRDENLEPETEHLTEALALFSVKVL